MELSEEFYEHLAIQKRECICLYFCPNHLLLAKFMSNQISHLYEGEPKGEPGPGKIAGWGLLQSTQYFYSLSKSGIALLMNKKRLQTVHQQTFSSTQLQTRVWIVNST